jgi:prevent-host-death family protein
MATKKRPGKKKPGKSARGSAPAIKTAAGKAAVVKASVFKAKCLDLMDEVQERHISIVVTKRGHPVAKLTPMNDSTPSPFGFMKGTLVSDHGLIDAEHDAWAEADTDPLG